MEMILHEHPSMHPPAMTPTYLPQPEEKSLPILIVFKNYFPSITSGHHMINRSRILMSQRPWHNINLFVPLT
jgi:hypothetical protein